MHLDSKHGVYRWRKQIRLSDGSPLRLSGTSLNKTQARRDRDRAVSKALSESPRRLDVKLSPTFEAFAETWLATFPAARSNRATTIESKTYHVWRRLVPCLGPLLLSEITAKVIERLSADLLSGEKPLAPSTVRGILQTLRRMLRSAVVWGELDSVPEFPEVKTPPAKFDYLTFEEAERLLAYTKENAFGAYALLLTALRTGPRAGELLGLTWDRVDFERGTIRYDRQLSKSYRPTQVDRPGTRPELVPLKAGERTVPIGRELNEALFALRARGGSMFVFAGRLSGEPFSRWYLKTLFEGALAPAGLRKLHPHALRHTFASHCAMKGIPLQQIQQWLGHSSISMTERYAHLAPTSRAAADLIRLLG